MPAYIPHRKRNKAQKANRRIPGCYTFAAPDFHDDNSIAHFSNTSADGRRQYREREAVPLPSPAKNANLNPERELNQFEPDSDPYFDNFTFGEHLPGIQLEDEDAVKPRSRRYVASVSIFPLKLTLLLILTYKIYRMSR